MTDDTIYALGSAAGRAGIAVIRVSGPQAFAALNLLTGGAAADIAVRRAVLCRLRDPLTKEVLDSALVLKFPGPKSFTGEDVAELHLHGSQAVVAGVLEALGTIGRLRSADAGEFTRRAFYAGRMDLTEAEGLADLIEAETISQRRQALAQMQGGLARQFSLWRDRLIRALAHMEADIDFPDEDMPIVLPAVKRDLTDLVGVMAQALAATGIGERIRNGVRVALLGPPNAGKSSLLNRFAQRDVAIVSNLAGTTRDVIETRLELNGMAVILSDTAGVHDSRDAIEQEGMRRALAEAERADLCLLLAEAADAENLGDLTRFRKSGSALIINKIDQMSLDEEKIQRLSNDGPLFQISVKTGAGLETLVAWLEAQISPWRSKPDQVLMTRNRHRQGIMRCETALRRALGETLPELAAEEIRLAIYELGRLTGRVDVEDVLDVVFQDFCIGK